ncbi:NACHT domain-containing protein [Herbidospora sp. RD11066]
MRTHEPSQVGLAGLQAMLMEVTAGRVPPPKSASIHALNAAALTRPISQSDEEFGLRMPSLGESYVVPLFRLIADPSRSDLSLESVWAAEEIRSSLGQTLAGHLTSAEALQAPLLIFGQPGAGKSVLTQMLAARLPRSDFLPIRVPLRQVPADAGIQEQIETGVHVTTGETISWPDLARSAEGALPVVLLDGLDELLQATGVNRTDYLRQAMEFQEREASLGRPLAVVITTRTAVADRFRVPFGSVALRLEPFSDAQVAIWVETWNRSTGAGLSLQSVLGYPDLARQPLLLLMLALYDADGTAFTGHLLQSELYERLLSRFAAREIRRHQRDLNDRELTESIEFELLRLSVAAFAMLNRGQQWVTHSELNHDLSALLPTPTSVATGFQRPLTTAQKVLGRFFFVHQAQALQDSAAVSTYEFLHATFGEYLIARLIRNLVWPVTEGESPRRHFQTKSHQPLAELLSFAVLATREPILRFLSEMRKDNPHVRPLLVRLFQVAYFGTSTDRGDYRPTSVSAARNAACQTANMLLLLTILTGPIRATELFGGRPDVVSLWQNLVDLWRANWSSEEGLAVDDWLIITRTEENLEHEITVTHLDESTPGLIVDPGEITEWTHERREFSRIWGSQPVKSRNTGNERYPLRAPADVVASQQPEPATTFRKDQNRPTDPLLGLPLKAWLASNSDSESLQLAQPSNPWMQRRFLELVWSERHRLSTEVIAHICKGTLRAGSNPPDLLLDCFLYLATRTQDYLDLIDELLHALNVTPAESLLTAVTLMELDIDPSAVPMVAFGLVRGMHANDFEKIAASDPHLYNRARRIIRAEGSRYRLTWPGSSPAPSE